MLTGLLEGAHTGMGLGHEFLRHCQRSRILVHIIDGTSPDPINDFQAICTELQLFNPELAEKPQVLSPSRLPHPPAHPCPSAGPIPTMRRQRFLSHFHSCPEAICCR